MVSNEPVTVSFGNGIIEADGLEVTDNGKVMHFKGRVRTVFEPFRSRRAQDAAGTRSTAQSAGAPRPNRQVSVR